jgi:hypothetical protein
MEALRYSRGTILMLAVVGILLTMAGIVVGIIPPQIAARWSSAITDRQEKLLARRYYVGLALVAFGAAFQIPGVWPVGGIGVQQWAVQELGLIMDFAGVILLVVEWTKAFSAQGRWSFTNFLDESPTTRPHSEEPS